MNDTAHTPRPDTTPGWASSPPPEWTPASRPSTPARPSRLPSGAEALGWAGGVVTLIGVIAVTVDHWGAALMGGWPLFGLLALSSGVLAGAAAQVGAVDREGTDRVAANLAGGLGVMAGLTGIWTVYVGVDTAADGQVYLGVLAAAAAATAVSAVVARRTGRDVWRAISVVAGAATVFAGTALGTEDTVVRACAVAATGGAALVAASLVAPARTRVSQGTGLALMYAGAQSALVIGPLPWAAVVIVLVAVAVAVLVGFVGDRLVAAATAVAATLLAGTVATDQLPGLFTLSTAVLAAGVGMTVACIVLVRRASRES